MDVIQKQNLDKLYPSLQEDHSPDALSIWSDCLKELGDPSWDHIALALLYCRDFKKWPYQNNRFEWCWAKETTRSICKHSGMCEYHYDLPHELWNKLSNKSMTQTHIPYVAVNIKGETMAGTHITGAKRFSSLAHAIHSLSGTLIAKRKREARAEEARKKWGRPI